MRKKHVYTCIIAYNMYKDLFPRNLRLGNKLSFYVNMDS